MKQKLLALLTLTLLTTVGSHPVLADDISNNVILEDCDDAAIDSAVICGGTQGVKTDGWNWLTLQIVFTRGGGATGYSYYLETCHEGHRSIDCLDATDWHRVVIVKPVAGTSVLLSPDPVVRTVSANDQITYSFPLNYRRVRLGTFIGAGAATADDKITVHARFAVLPGM